MADTAKNSVGAEAGMQSHDPGVAIMVGLLGRLGEKQLTGADLDAGRGIVVAMENGRIANAFESAVSIVNDQAVNRPHMIKARLVAPLAG